MSGLYTYRKQGESIFLRVKTIKDWKPHNEDIEIRVAETGATHCRLAVIADRSVTVSRTLEDLDHYGQKKPTD